MDCNAKSNREALQRIVAMLLAIAELADRASHASRPVRLHVLGILRIAEAVVRSLVVGMMLNSYGSMPPQACLAIGTRMCTHDSDDPDDAARLALGLRALALALSSFLAQSTCFAGCECVPHLGQRRNATFCRSPSCWRLAAAEASCRPTRPDRGPAMILACDS